MEDRPDFLVFMCDQLTPFMLGAYGQTAAQTPVIDEMARPLFMTASFTQPHEPFAAPREYWGRFPIESVPEPPDLYWTGT